MKPLGHFLNQNALKPIHSHMQFQKFYGGETPNPGYWGHPKPPCWLELHTLAMAVVLLLSQIPPLDENPRSAPDGVAYQCTHVCRCSV